MGRRAAPDDITRALVSEGFTLLELVFVLAIALIVSSMALLQVDSMVKRSRLQSAGAAVSGAIQSTRLRAVSTGIPFKLTFYSARSTYQVSNCSTCSMGSAIAYDKSESEIPFSSTPTVALAAGAVLYFHPDGSVQAIDGIIDCSAPVATLSLSSAGLTKTITASCYGKTTVSQ